MGEEGCCKRAEERKREERGREKGRVENKDRDEKEREDTGTKELDKAMLERILCVRSGARYRRMLPRCFEAWLFRVFLRASRTHDTNMARHMGTRIMCAARLRQWLVFVRIADASRVIVCKIEWKREIALLRRVMNVWVTWITAMPCRS